MCGRNEIEFGFPDFYTLIKRYALVKDRDTTGCITRYAHSGLHHRKHRKQKFKGESKHENEKQNPSQHT